MLVRRRQALLAGLLPLLPRAARAEEATPDAQARWLAGMNAHPTHTPDAEWLAYAESENERWRTTLARVSAMQTWATRELVPLLPRDAAVFYPFAGPDALSALALFGTSRRLVLVGLEPIGSVPDPASGPASAGFFTRLGTALSDIHRLTFFRTQEMANDFRRDGVLGALVTTLARLGRKITSIRIQAASASLPARARVEWTNDAGQSCRLEYVEANLANHVIGGSGIVAGVQAMAPCVTFVKAAMYLLPEARFSTLRQAIVDASALVVQDDTGVPFRAFDPRWTIRLFGRYEAPAAPFADRLQPDLRAAYERRTPALLPFGIGYPVEARRSNLLVASKGS